MRTLKSIVITVLTTFLYGCNDTIVGAVAITLLLASLGLVDEDAQEDAYQSCEHPIQSSFDATFVANRIADTLDYGINQLGLGVYNEEKVSCYSGLMTISGVLSGVYDEPCGSGCTRDSLDHDVIVTLSNCILGGRPTFTLPYSITGDVVLSNSMAVESHADGTFIPSGDYIITDNGTEIAIEPSGYQCDNTMGEIVDTIYSLYAYETFNWTWNHYIFETIVITGSSGTYEK